MSTGAEDFFYRWSRRKRAAAAALPPAPAQPMAALPPLETLTYQSDFKAFMHTKVDEGLKRAALRKLFGDPHFNVMDGLDIYIDDYTKADAIPEAMLATLEHAKATLFAPPPAEQAEARDEGPAEDA